MERTLLIDGDILLYAESSAVEEAWDWGNDIWTLHGDAKIAKERVDVWLIGRLPSRRSVDQANSLRS